MTVLIDAAEAARRLGIRPATLYAYVSRGRVSRQRSVDGRRSLFAADEIDRLAADSRRPEPVPRAVPVSIETSITEIGEGRLRYRGRDVAELAGTATFEQVSELLWTGDFTLDAGPWVAPDVVLRAAASGGFSLQATSFSRLAGGLLGAGAWLTDADPLVSARSLLAVAPAVFGGPDRGPMARRVGQIWRHPAPKTLVAALDRALILLADHELATCTFAARVAASTRADLAECLATGVMTLAGPLHGGAAQAAHHLFSECAERGAPETLERYRRSGELVPGFGHRVYKSGDPRVAPLLDAVRALGPTVAAPARLATVAAVLDAAGPRVPVAPNVDFGLGALSFAAGLPTDAGSVIMAIARLSGMAAHVLEEYAAPPLRYRVTGRFHPGPT